VAGPSEQQEFHTGLRRFRVLGVGFRGWGSGSETRHLKSRT
jgi:hypothetical protein